MRRAIALALVLASASAVMVGLVARALPLGGLVAISVVLTALPGLLAIRRDRVAAVAVMVSALVIGPMLAVPTFAFAHPPLHIDNAGDAPIDIWIDGVRRMTVAGNRDGREPVWTRVSFGRHRLAWSSPGAPVGLHEIEVDITPLDDHLYAPAAMGCYWLSVTAYGGASTHGIDHGPLPLAEFHKLARVDVWFADNPGRIRAPKLTGGTVRVAIQRWHACMELAAIGCDPGQRRGYVDCMRTIDGHSSSGDCFQEAARTCPAAASSHVKPAAQSAKP